MTFVDDERVRRLVALAAEPEVVAGRFELGMPLGEGGMGVVFEAWDREARRTVALKLLRKADQESDKDSNEAVDAGVDAATSARFEREAEALARLSHPGIVGYIAHGRTAQGERYLAMERLVGVTLAARLAEGPLGVQAAARVGHGIAVALAAAHSHDLVHRDIKPSNIFLRDRATTRVLLLDFGLARGTGAPPVTRTGALVGTPGYMAPEQVRGTVVPDARGDLFALGAVLFECLTGRAPFVGADTEAVLAKILIEQPPLVRQLCPAVPAPFEALIARLLAKDPDRRPTDAAEVARELAALLSAQLAEQHADTTPAAGGDSAAALAAPDTLQPGTLIAGKYRVVRTLGSGGMGIVLLARHDALDRNVAIKLLRGSESTPGSGGVARLVREARAASRLESEHVARVMDVDVLDDGAPFIVMEYLSGQDLAQVLRREQRLPVSVVIEYVLQAGKALAEAHALGIVHRDLKPSNLFLTTRRDGSPLIKVLDFGISKVAPASDAARSELLPSEASITAPDAILGSPLYMSPEQLQSAKHVDARTDIWSLGVVLQELLTGRPPFAAESFLAVAARVAAGAPAELRAGCPEAPEGLAAVVRRCLEKDPAQRFRSIGELAQALAPYAPGNPAQAPTRRRGVLVVGLGAALVLGAALLAARGIGGTNAPAVEAGALTALSATARTASAVSTATPASSAVTASPAPPQQIDAGARTSDAPPSSSAPPPPPQTPPSSARTRRVPPPRERPWRTTPAVAGSHFSEKPKPDNARDPMDPALLSR